MVRNVIVDDYESVPRPVLAYGNDYPPSHEVAPHTHRRSQLLHGITGVMLVDAGDSAWVVPPERAVWIPAGTLHRVRTIGAVATRGLLIQPDAWEGMPVTCQVLGVPPLMDALLREAIDMPPEYDPDSRDGLIMALLMEETRRAPVLAFSLTFPTHPALAARCRHFIESPSPHETTDAWCHALGMSRRTFTRLFRAQTGMSFREWRQQACLFAALPRLAAGEPVTALALDLGYESPAAFTSMFKRVLGRPPSRYLKAEHSTVA
jgi:AraC-like DNA-binding protein